MEINYKRRQRIALIISFIILWYMFFVFANDLDDDSDGITATCTVTKAYTRERGGTVSGMNDIRPTGIFRDRRMRHSHDDYSSGRSQDSRVC